MRRRGDGRKYREWKERLGRFEASGLTVAGFCRHEGVGAHRFYYWAKRVRDGKAEGFRNGGRLASGGEGRSDLVPAAGKHPSAMTGVERSACGDVLPSLEPRVDFRLGSELHVSVPAGCLEAIRCVLQFASRDPESPGPLPTCSAFRQVVIAE